MPLLNLSSTTLCNPSAIPPGVHPALLVGRAVVVLGGECNISRKALVAKSLGVGALLVASRTYLVGRGRRVVGRRVVGTDGDG